MSSSNPDSSQDGLGDESQRDQDSQRDQNIRDSGSSRRSRSRSRRNRVRDLSTQFEIGDATIGSGGKPTSSKPAEMAGGNDSPGDSPGDAAMRYVSMGEVGRGGWGVVERAVDRQLNREVAVKRFTDAGEVTEEERQRFLREAKVTSQLQHPGIVPVHEMGDRQDAFYVMKLLDGMTFSEFIDRQHQDKIVGKRLTRFQFGEALEPLLQRFVDVCNAVAYAHERGIIHRDLKPANVMIGEFGETVVLDWGLAQSDKLPATQGMAKPGESSRCRYVDSMGELSATVEPDGTVLGTPAYMSPEQAAGDVSGLNRSSDIYSLGVILFSIVNGRHPYHGQTLGQILEQVKNADSPSLRSVQPLTPSPLEAIVRKAMAAEQVDRYASAEQLASDVRRFIAGESVSAYQETSLEKGVRWCRHHQGLSATIAVSAFVLLFASLVFGVVIKQAHAAEQIARISAERAHRETILSLSEARDATDTWLIELSGSLQFYPGMASLRQELLERAIVQYDRIASQNVATMAEANVEGSAAREEHPEDFGRRTDRLAVLEQVKSHLRLGDLFRLTGKNDQAQEHYQNAERLVQNACAADKNSQRESNLDTESDARPDESLLDLERRFELERINSLIGRLLMQDQSPADAELAAKISEARRWMMPLVASVAALEVDDASSQLDSFVARVASAFVRMELAVWRASLGGTETALADREADMASAIRMARALTQQQDHVNARRLSETIQTEFCQHLVDTTRYPHAAQAWTQLIADLEHWLSTDRERIDYMQSLAHARLQRGNCLAAVQDYAAAKADYEASIALLEQAWRLTDDDGFYRTNLAAAESNLGQLLVRSEVGDPERAHSLLHRSLETYASLLQEEITVDRLRRYAMAHQALAVLPIGPTRGESEGDSAQVSHAEKASGAFDILKDYQPLTTAEELCWMRAELILARHHAACGEQNLLIPRLVHSRLQAEQLSGQQLPPQQRQDLQALIEDLSLLEQANEASLLIHKTDTIEPAEVQ